MFLCSLLIAVHSCAWKNKVCLGFWKTKQIQEYHSLPWYFGKKLIIVKLCKETSLTVSLFCRPCEELNPSTTGTNVFVFLKTNERELLSFLTVKKQFHYFQKLMMMTQTLKQWVYLYRTHVFTDIFMSLDKDIVYHIHISLIHVKKDPRAWGQINEWNNLPHIFLENFSIAWNFTNCQASNIEHIWTY